MTDAEPIWLIEMQSISKAFGASRVLKDVTLRLRAGSVHALMGENGAGKSTLMKILAGVHRSDAGRILKNGEPLHLPSPREALAAGISTVFQEMSLLPNLTIAENMFLGREPLTGSGSPDRRKMRAETAKALAELDLRLDPDQLVSTLTIAERQFVEIAHGIKADASVLILDEPTAALNAADVEVLNRSIRRLKAEGKAIVYISHRMDEIFDMCDEVTVLKDGQYVGTKTIRDVTQHSLIAMMVGRELSDLYPVRAASFGQPVLELTAFRASGKARPFDLMLRQGEILGLAGLEGQGQQKIMRSLMGRFVPAGGSLRLHGQALKFPRPVNGIRAMAQLGVGFVPEDRKEEGLMLGLSVASNLVIALHSERPAFTRARGLGSVVKQMMDSLHVKAASPAIPVGSLSGGNQQKVLLGRYLARNVKLLVIEEPTRGVDIGAKSEIYRLLRDFANVGGAVLVTSRETIELIGLCDRLAVVHGDTVVAAMPAADATEHSILAAALTTSEVAA
ncbi:MAG: sugar ABC transporter ATP-binding protein [Pseudomonadota bacterium]